MKFGNFFEGKKNQGNTQKILPQDVRYALAHNQAQMGKNEIEALVLSNFENEAVYLALKSLQHDPVAQKNFLEKYVNFYLHKSGDQKADRDRLESMVKEALGSEKDIAVEGDKLAQVSRQGFELWQEKLSSLAKELSADHRDVYLVAHSMMLGLGSFSEEFSKNNKKLNIIIPSWIEKEGEHLGYSVNFKKDKGDVQFMDNIPKESKDNAVLVDDVIRTGQSLEKIKSYWAKDSSKEPDIVALINLK
jgi:hypoxanthine-guanine phosphoribosyltransferase